MSEKRKPTSESIDSAMVQAIVRRVMQQLHGSPANISAAATVEAAERLPDRIVTAQTVENKIGRTQRLHLVPGAIVTPAARDVARANRMELVFTGQDRDRQSIADAARLSQAATAEHALTLIDCNDDGREQLIRKQLSLRGIAAVGKFVLSDQPAAALYHQISEHGQVAVMVTSLADVDRFEQECRPGTWVLDMKRLNLPAVVNTIVRVTQLVRNRPETDS